MPGSKLLITGGHITPALAVIPTLKKHGAEIIFVGRNHTGRQGFVTKEQELIGKSAQFISFDAPKLHSKPVSRNLIELVKTPGSLYSARHILTTHQPDLILTFGGYLALPLALVARLLHIPIITHEQTMVLGKTNQILGRMSHTLALSWPDTRSVSSSLLTKTVVTGNPLRLEFFASHSKPTWYTNHRHLPTIYVTGGNQGAQAINSYVLNHLKSLTNRYYLVHQTGVARGQEDLDLLLAARKQLPSDQQFNYHLAPWYDSSEVAWLMRHANLVIGRAGANTVTELLVAGTPSILIPLPFSAGGEQQANATLLENFGLATALPQPRLSELITIISHLISSPRPHLPPTAIKLQQLHRQASLSLTQVVLSCLQNSGVGEWAPKD